MLGCGPSPQMQVREKNLEERSNMVAILASDLYDKSCSDYCHYRRRILSR